MLLIDGNIVYQGTPMKSVSYFASIGYSCPRFANPADYFMKILTLEYPKAKEDDLKIQNLS